MSGSHSPVSAWPGRARGHPSEPGRPPSSHPCVLSLQANGALASMGLPCPCLTWLGPVSQSFTLDLQTAATCQSDLVLEAKPCYSGFQVCRVTDWNLKNAIVCMIFIKISYDEYYLNTVYIENDSSK